MSPNYKAFTFKVLKEALAGCDWDGGSLQDLAVKHRILKKVKYDPASHGPNDIDAAPGDPWFVFINEAAE